MEFEAIIHRRSRSNPDEKQPKRRRVLALVRARAGREFCRPRHRALRPQRRTSSGSRTSCAPSRPTTFRSRIGTPAPMTSSGPADDGGPFTYFEFPESLAGAQNRAVLHDQRPERQSDLQEHRVVGDQAAREPVAVHGLLLGHEEGQSPITTGLAPPRLRGCVQHDPRGRVLHAQRQNQPGRSDLGMGCQVLGVLHLPGRRAGVGELPPHQRRRRTRGRCSSGTA